MCGIAGWLQRDGRPIDARVLRTMTDTLVHRGPDDSGIWVDGRIGLGHRRLSIRDLSPLGRQPMADSSGRAVATFNGEIYNDSELRQQLLRDHPIAFRSTCDAETIPYAYLAWGLDAFSRMEGIFAIALWDRETQTLHLARDAIGTKPLFYAVTDASVVFGSEPKALLASGLVSDKFDPESLHAFLATGQPGPADALFSGMQQVPPGSVVSIDASGVTITTYWTPRRDPQIFDLDEAVGELTSTISQVIQSQLISDVDLGVLLSGGIDSTIVTLVANSLGVEMPVFTASFADKTYDETDLAGMVARKTRLQHEIIDGDGGIDVETAFRGVVHATDGQAADTGSMGFYQLAGAVSRKAKVVLSGDGGDEFFAGYDTYRATRLAAKLPTRMIAPFAASAGQGLYGMFPRAEGRVPRSAKASRFLLGVGAGDAPPHLQWRRLAPHFMLPSLYGSEMQGVLGISPYNRYAAFYDGIDGDVLTRALIADQRYHLQSVLAKVDTMSMAHALEVRVPLLDRRVMDLAGRIDTSLMLPPKGRPKHVLRRLATKLGAPDAITDGAKKGFNTPIATLMRGPLARLGDQLLDRNPDLLSPYLQVDTVRKLWRDHRDRRANHAFALWPILTLAAWRAGEGRPMAPALPRSVSVA